MFKQLIIAAAMAASPLFSQQAFASGSDSGGGGQTDEMQSYNAGKGVFAQKIACKSCPMAGKNLDAAFARDLVAGKGTEGLDAEDKAALKVYLTRRFKL